MASGALRAGLISAFSSWLESAKVGQSPPANTVSKDTASPIVRRSKSQIPATSLLASRACGVNACWREKAKRRLVSAAARVTPCKAMSRADNLCRGVGGLQLRNLPADQIEPAQNESQEIVEVVGDAAGQLADGLHLLSLPQLLFEATTLRYVSCAHEYPSSHALFARKGHRNRFDDAVFLPSFVCIRS